MRLFRSTLAIISIAGFIGASAPANAAPVIFFGEDINASGSFVAGGNSSNARENFLDALTAGVSTENFESFTVGETAPLALSFTGGLGTIGATLSGNGSIRDSSLSGRFAASPVQWWQLSDDGLDPFAIEFTAPIAAFGFYATDVGDYDGQITLTLDLAGGGQTMLIVPNTKNGPDASLLFYGFIDTASTFTKVTFGNTAPGTDIFGFDDLTIGDVEQVLPSTPVAEPATLAVLGAGLAGIGLMARRRKTTA